MRRFYLQLTLAGAIAALASGCGGAQGADGRGPGEEGDMTWQAKAEAFLGGYFEELGALELAQTSGYWKAANTGVKEDFDAFAAADLALKKLHSSSESYAVIEELLTHRDELEPLTVRALEVAYNEFKGNQLPEELLTKMVNISAEIERSFSTFRGELDGVKLSNNELLEMLADETDTAKRKRIWESLKQVGAEVGPKLVKLAAVRNEAAVELGYANFWEMRVRLQEHDPEELMAVFADLEKSTDAPFKRAKAALDGELAKRFKVDTKEMMPWHYDNPFFQAAPPSAAIDLDVFYEKKKREDIAALAGEFFKDVGLDGDDIIARSDLYEREGKDQHAFCIAIDRQGDVRTLLNVKPTAEWMGTMLHELGHAVYYKFLDYELPYNLREAAHIFSTEAVAMLFGALASNPTWLVDYAGADKAEVEKSREAILEQRRREQLIFARWTMVMLHFEKALYEDPSRDLNKLWWDYVERFQLLTRPADRDAADWAAKPHFTIAPVYYHNYMLGEIFAAQLRAVLAKKAGHEGSPATLSFTDRRDFGEYLSREIFEPGMRLKWSEFVDKSTGEPLTAKHFAGELE